VKVFIDTGAFIARFIEKNQYHQQAVKLWELLRQEDAKCVTSNFVLDETFTLLGRRAGYGFAHERALNLYASQALTIVRPALDDEMIGLNYFKKYADQSISFTDCISFALMDRIQTHRVFPFDTHFSWAGYLLLQ